MGWATSMAPFLGDISYNSKACSGVMSYVYCWCRDLARDQSSLPSVCAFIITCGQQ